jgi:hypothetical protein
VPLKVSDTFLMGDTGGAANRAGAHLMICMGIDGRKNTAIIVPVVSRHDLSDTSCTLGVGDHPFIKHDSCVAYDFARLVSLSEINEKIDKNLIRLGEAVSDDVLKRVQVGFVMSDETAPWIYEAGYGDKLKSWLQKHRYMS